MASLLAPPAPSAEPPAVRDRLHQLLDAGHFGSARVEIIGGELYTTMPETPIHAYALTIVFQALLAGQSEQASVFAQNYVDFPLGDTLVPDVFVLRADLKKGPQPITSADLLLVVEVSNTTLRRDRTLKSEEYARAGVSEYWIVDPVRRRIEVRREPQDAEYLSIHTYEGDQTIRPLFAPELALRVEGLLPAPAAE